MKNRISLRSMFVATALALAGLNLAGMGVAAADPVWDRIESSGNIVCGAIPNDPVGSWVDRQTGQWEGYEIDLCRAIAADLSKEMGKEIKPEFRETGWKTVVLDLQSNKIDIWPGMSATPEREKALSMIGPMYGLAFCGVTGKSFQSEGTWESLNKPEVRIATVTGTSIETAFKKLAPNATHVTLSEYSEVTLAVQSGRADIMGADALRCLNVHKSASHAFGDIVFPTPIQSMGSSAGIIKAADRLAPWLKKWSEEKQASGEVKAIFVKVLNNAGFDTSVIPPEVQF
ncbi:transporter substrate-binding domain-containing protein [Pseudaminobacter sp. 19-2017]|uniref:Transporter substrate-binding domain-containing protein n=1 Tax=Pseudaminobacter soli (ex Zhang et al. 2022) TaxID=2831468 RepID=A0A942I2T9_9HYPH|nr:transporter substrate-binding domain-containing protein [Pseudaminobacter soli]